MAQIGNHLAPEHVKLKSIVCLLQVYEVGMEGALGKAGVVQTVTQGKRVDGWRTAVT